MKTKRTVENLSGLNDKFRVKVEAFISDLEAFEAKNTVRIEVISGTRSWRQQEALYAQGRTTPGRICTNAKPGSSWHNYGLAIDLGLFRSGRYLDEAQPRIADALYQEIAKIAAKHGIEWAGNWKTFAETPHFQWTAGQTLAQLREKMQKSGYDVQKLV